jgi:hypothetical protein
MRFCIILIVILGTSCLDKLSYRTGHTYSIKESKERNVFIESYELSFSDSISDFYNLKFREVYIERLFKYGRKYNSTITDNEFLRDKYQLIFRLKQKSMFVPLSYLDIYSIKQENVTLNIMGRGTLYTNIFDSTFISDTIVFSIVERKTKEKICNMTFIKKTI